MEGDFALRVHTPRLNVRLFQHRHGFGAQDAGFLPQAAGQRHLSLHHRLTGLLPLKALHGQFFSKNFRGLGPAAVLFPLHPAFLLKLCIKVCGEGGEYAFPRAVFRDFLPFRKRLCYNRRCHSCYFPSVS